MYVYRWSQDLMYKKNVSNEERKKKRYIISSLHPLKYINTPPNKMIPKTNSPPKSDYSRIQNYSPFLS